MLRKTYILFFLLLCFCLGAGAWASSHTAHKDYATMAIKDCNDCHKSSGVQANHGGMWTKEHRRYAAEKPNNCQDCHQLSFCLDCHVGGGLDGDMHKSNSGPDYMPRSHRTDFREIHPIAAHDDPQSCFRCHEARKFCEPCHSKFNRNDLALASHRKQFTEIQVTSVGPRHEVFTAGQCKTCHVDSVLPVHEWSATHAREARKNLSSCQTCHPEGDVCMKCHSAKTGLGINPHPRNWGNIKGRLGRASDNRTCLKCHITVP